MPAERWGRVVRVVALTPLVILLGVVLELILQEARVNAAPPPPVSPGQYQGAAACADAKCHDRPEQRGFPPYLTEYTSWSATDAEGIPYDRHSYAYVTLMSEDDGGDPRSVEIMAKLNELEGTSGSAEESPRCLECHGTSLPDYGVSSQTPNAPVALHEELQGGEFDALEGVSCEACHGPAEKWLKPHTKTTGCPKSRNEPDAKVGWVVETGKAAGTEALFNEHGYYYQKDLVRWAEGCTRCHLAIDTNLLEAGHPDLEAFELFSQSAQVPHWRDYTFCEDAPGFPSAGPFHPVSSWQTGQVVAIRIAAQQLGDRARGAGRNKAEERWLRNAFDRLYGHYMPVRHALKLSAPGAAPKLEEEMTALEALLPYAGPVGDAGPIAARADAIRDLAAGLRRQVADHRLDGPGVTALLKEVVKDPVITTVPKGASRIRRDRLERVVEQLRMGVYAL